MGAAQTRMAVVGHVEWVQFAHVPHVPRAGEVMHATAPFDEPAGGGAVAAVQLARLAGAAALFTSLGRDEHAARSVARLGELGVTVHSEAREKPTRRAVTFLDDAGERTIVTLGARLEPRGRSAEIAWQELEGSDGIYFTAGDADALRGARGAARVLVASPRAGEALRNGVRLDALVLSGEDEIERGWLDGARDAAGLVVLTEGARGGSWTARDGAAGRWQAAPLVHGRADSYGCGDSFAAGFTYGLAAGLGTEAALGLAARCGAACLGGHGPYETQLRAGDLRAGET